MIQSILMQENFVQENLIQETTGLLSEGIRGRRRSDKRFSTRVSTNDPAEISGVGRAGQFQAKKIENDRSSRPACPRDFPRYNPA
jgi:hypothetical protein